jgi:hypothetical protein
MKMSAAATAAAVALTLALGASRPSQGKPAAAKPAVDPEAISALHQMGEFLRNQQTFSVQARQTTDDVLASGQKVQYGGTVDLKVRRPDRLRMDIQGDRRNEHLLFDGKTFTVYPERVGFYAQFPAPPTLAELKDVLEKRYGIDLPLADLFYWGTERDGTSSITAATRIGVANVDGFICHHYAFRQKDLDWELWIEQGGRPVPRKQVITTTTDRSKPQHSMVLNWDLSPKLEDQMFAFVPPPTAHKIEFEITGRPGASRAGAAQ